MATPRKPQDHKTKQVEPSPDEPFEFEHNGETFTLAAPSSVLTVGWSRKNRHRGAEDLLFTLLEAIADEDALAAIDDMRKPEFIEFQKAFYAHAGVELGE